MAKPTKEQIQKLEGEHKTQFVNLVLANRLWIRLLPKIKGKSKTSIEYRSMVDLAKNIEKNALKWLKRQQDFEKNAGVPKASADILTYFFKPKEEEKLNDQARKYIRPENYEQGGARGLQGIAGIGIIPLIIWAVIAIVAAYTAVKIVDELNTTAEEKADLMQQTEKTIKDLNITGPAAASIIAQTQEQASASSSGEGLLSSVTGGGTGKLLLYGVIAYFIFSKTGNAQAQGAYASVKSRIKK